MAVVLGIWGVLVLVSTVFCTYIVRLNSVGKEVGYLFCFVILFALVLIISEVDVQRLKIWEGDG